MKSLDLADSLPTNPESTTIELLLGNDYYLDIVLPQRIEVQNGLYLLSSKLGWILSGRTAELDELSNDTSMIVLTYGTDVASNVFTNIDSAIPTKPELEDFWNIESIGVTDKPQKMEDAKVMENFKNSLTFENNRYQVTWPWKSEHPDLPQNRELALFRLKSCLSKLKTKPELLKRYDGVIQDQLTKGVIETVDTEREDGIKHYLPHHAVIIPTKATTKLRVVYDASAKSRQKHQCLNDCLYRGPVMLHDLCGILLRFRLHSVALVADIEKAFLQVGLQPDQRDVTRFFWIKIAQTTVLSDENLQEFRFCRVPFGVVSSLLLGATIEYHLNTYATENAEKLKGDIYVDNVITGTNTVEEAKILYKDAKTMFQDASMNLREWVSNKEEVNSFIPKEDRSENKIIKVLGYQWNYEKDTISVTPASTLHSLELTKRSVLKQLSSVYDPLGIFAPVILRGKILLQRTWSIHLDWDEEMDRETTNIWLALKPDLQRVSDVNIPRSLIIESSGDKEFSLVCFCDASKSAYAAVIYLLQKGKILCKCDLLFAKTRLAPLKEITIPRLELMAVLIGVRCLKFVRENLGLKNIQTYLLSDSQCVLNWVNTDKALSVFVQNRVNEIKGHTDVTFGYVPSGENPADIASRGSSVQNLSENSLWWHGPVWLTKPEQTWVIQQSEEEIRSEFESELKTHVHGNQSEILSVTLQPDKQLLTDGKFVIDVKRFSSATKLLRVTALVIRFIRKLRKLHTQCGPIKSSELRDAESLWIRHVQKEQFSDVIYAISEQKPNNLQRQLGIYIDSDGILRCRGRLEHAELSESSRFPILLPRNERFTILVVERIHKQNMHSGISQTLSQIRTRFWIPQGRATVRSVLQTCVVCRRYEGGNYKMPPMAPLPKSRVSHLAPFSKTGLDYFGPVYIKYDQQAKKVWICLFTCMSTRAVHLELVNDMTTDEFLMAVRRFIAQRGKPLEIISDNATQFKAASRLLSAAWKGILKSDGVLNYVANEGIVWSFIVELAPWMGGFYERLVGVVKRALRKSLGRRLLTLIQLQTLLKEVESVVNSRPLVYLGDDINSNIALTPGHFLCLNPKVGIPEMDYDEQDPDFTPNQSSSDRLLTVWKKGQKVLNKFWKLWRDEYLLSLRERSQSQLKEERIHSHSKPQIGDIVQIKDNISRGCWKLGKIVSLIKSRDCQMRAAKVQISPAKVLNRPLNLLYPIEVSDKIPQKDEVKEKQESVSPVSRPFRLAALKAKQKLQNN